MSKRTNEDSSAVANLLRADNLRRFRLARQLAQLAMAEKCQFPGANTVSMMEAGAMPISLKTVDRIAAAFSLTASAVLEELDRVAHHKPLPEYHRVSSSQRVREIAALTGDASSLQDFKQTLHGRELEIFRDRVIADKPATLKALGDRWNVSPERVRQMEKRILVLLRNHKILEST